MSSMSSLSTYVVTFNCGRAPVNPSTFSSHVFSALPKPSLLPEIFVLCLQEVAPIAYSFLGGSYLNFYTRKFEQAVNLAANAANGSSFRNIVTHNAGMTVIMIFVAQDSVSKVGNILTSDVGVGFWRMGNKGAAAVRLTYSAEDDEQVNMHFVSAHLAPMEDAWERRNQDYKNIARRLVFETASTDSTTVTDTDNEVAPLLSSVKSSDSSISSVSGIYNPTSHLIFAGDLNYRTAAQSPFPEEHAYFPQPCEDDSYPRHFEHLLTADQLMREMRAKKTCHLLKEAPIEFPPTYKYSDKARDDILKGITTAETMDDQEDGIWKWALHRWPSWCDRVLYLDPSTRSKGSDPSVSKYTALPLMVSSDHRPVACHFQIPKVAISNSSSTEFEPPFTIDSNWKWKRQFARQLEIIVGIAALLTTTNEGLLALSAVVLIAIAGSTSYLVLGGS